MGKPPIPEHSVHVLGHHDEISRSKSNQEVKLVAFDRRLLAGHEQNRTVGMPRRSIESDKRVLFRPEVAERKDGTADGYVQAISINASADETEVASDRSQFVKAIVSR